jgi:hypothetical protein
MHRVLMYEIFQKIHLLSHNLYTHKKPIINLFAKYFENNLQTDHTS